MRKPTTHRRLPKQSRSKATVAAILEAAAKTFSETAIEKVNTRQVAERAGVGVGSLYEYFADKQSLVAALVQIFADQVRRGICDVCDQRVGESLEVIVARLMRNTVEVYDRNAALHARLLRYVPFLQGDNPLDVIEAPIRDRFATLLRDCAEEIEVADIDRAALVCVHAARRMVEAAGADPAQAIDVYAIEKEVSSMLLRYLRGPSPSASTSERDQG